MVCLILTFFQYTHLHFSKSKKKLQAERDEELRQLGLLNVVPKSTQNQKSNTNLQEEIVEEVPKSLEEILEELRANLKGPLTKVTKASFEEWHAKKQAEKAEKRRIKMGKREKDIASGKVAMTGRELYEKKKDIFVDDNNADDDHYELYENLNQAIEDQLKLMEDASGETWDQERIQKERLKLEQEMAKSEEDRKKLLQKKLEETTIEIEDESLFVEEDIPDE